jgi:hypothetical protein
VAVADVAPELLAEQRLNIGLVVNNKNKQLICLPLLCPWLPCAEE